MKKAHNHTKPWTKLENETLLSFCSPTRTHHKAVHLAHNSGKLDRSFGAIRNRVLIINPKGGRYRPSFANKPLPAHGGCHMPGCKEPSVGKFCEAHARDGFPRNMSTIGLLQACGQTKALRGSNRNITMPKLRVMA